jgi:hypothetical protein
VDSSLLNFLLRRENRQEKKPNGEVEEEHHMWLVML